MTPLFPRRADNAYRGQTVALWVFGLLLLVFGAIAANSTFNGELVAREADGIPLATYTPAGARTVVTLFSLLGLSHVVFVLFGVVALVRYRSLVPLLFALLLLEHLGKRLILGLLPIARTGAPPAPIVNFVLLGLMVGGLALSLWGKPDGAGREL